MKNLKSMSTNVVCAVFLIVVINVAITSAQAQETGPYVTIGAGYATSNADEIELVETEAGLIIIRGGYNFNRYLGVEAEGNFTVLTPDIDPTGVNGREGAFNLSRGFSGFLVARYPVTENITLFARGGYHHSRLKLRSTWIDQSASFDNYAFGGGASYNWGCNGIRADYKVLNITRKTFDQRLLGVSFVRRF